MRNRFAAAALTLLLAAPLAVFAEEGRGQEPQSASPTTGRYNTFDGKLGTVTGRSIVVSEQTFLITNETRTFDAAGRSISLDRIKKNSRVTVDYHLGARNQPAADTVTVLESPQ